MIVSHLLCHWRTYRRRDALSTSLLRALRSLRVLYYRRDHAALCAVAPPQAGRHAPCPLAGDREQRRGGHRAPPAGGDGAICGLNAEVTTRGFTCDRLAAR